MYYTNKDFYQRASGDHSLSFDQKKCWEATEDHFVCLDKQRDVYGSLLLPFPRFAPRSPQTTTSSAPRATLSGPIPVRPSRAPIK